VEVRLELLSFNSPGSWPRPRVSSDAYVGVIGPARPNFTRAYARAFLMGIVSETHAISLVRLGILSIHYPFPEDLTYPYVRFSSRALEPFMASHVPDLVE
jgi:hypothetical protein